MKDGWQVEANRGCPFSCAYCDWGSATNSKVQEWRLTEFLMN